MRYEGLEDRQLLAVTNLASGILTIDFDVAGEEVTVSNDGANITLVGSIFTGGGATFPTAAVTGVQVSDSGNLGGEFLAFAGAAKFSLPDGLICTGIETISFNNEVTATGASSLIITAPQSITVSQPIASSGGNLSLLANNGLNLYNGVKSNGGSLVLRADADGDGSGTLSIAPSVLDRWTEQQKLNVSGSAVSGNFGQAMTLSSDGNTALIGAPFDTIGATTYQGSATVFIRSGGVWQLQQTLIASGAAVRDNLGNSVSLSADGNTALVGVYGDDVGSTVNQGSAIVFVRSNGVWTEQQTLTASDGATDDGFAGSVSLSADGNTALVGALYDDVGTVENQGTARVFVRSGGVWAEQQTLTASGGAKFDSFGNSVVLSADGNTALVGASQDDVGSNIDQGSARIFVRSGGVWTEKQTLIASGGTSRDGFGGSVTLSGDGMTALVLTPGDDVGGNVDQGSATVFVLVGGVWTEQQTLTASGGSASDFFGRSATLSFDGNTALVGIPNYDVGTHLNQGAVTVFARTGSVWSQSQILTESDGDLFTGFGTTVSLSADGRTVLVGGGGHRAGTNLLVGAARTFVLSSTLGGSVSALGGTVTLSAADSDIQGTIQSTSQVFIAPEKAGRQIDLGSNAAGKLGLTDVELDRIQTGTLKVGDTNTGTISVSSDLTQPGKNLSLTSSQGITGTGAIINGSASPTTLSIQQTGNSSFAGLIGGPSGGTVNDKNVSLAKSGTGNLTLTGANAFNGSTTITGSGTLSLSGSSANNLANSKSVLIQSGSALDVTGLNSSTIVLTDGQSLSGDGQVVGSTIAVSGSHVSPGTGPGILNTANITFQSGSHFDVELNGLTLGALYDQLNTVGVVSLGGSTLDLKLGFNPTVGNQFKIINNDSTDLVIGTFGGLPEGLVFSITTGSFASEFQITYAGGDGNDVVLTSIANKGPSLTRSSASITADVLTQFTNNGTWKDPESGPVTLSVSVGVIVKNADGTWNWSYTPSTRLINQEVKVTADDGLLKSEITFVITANVEIANRKVYYKGSSFASGGVDNALDPNKALAQSGATPKTLNYSNLINTTRGINGIVLDVAGLVSTNLKADDFVFRVSPTGIFSEVDNPPSSWATAPTLSSLPIVTPGNATTPARIRLEWSDNAIANRWLQIQVLANANTGLSKTEVFYLGHLQGELNGQLLAGSYFVSNADLTMVLPVGGGTQSVSEIRDVDKNGFATNADGVAIRESVVAGQKLRNITIPPSGSLAEGAILTGGGRVSKSLESPKSASAQNTLQPQRASAAIVTPLMVGSQSIATIESKQAGIQLQSSLVPQSVTATKKTESAAVLAVPQKDTQVSQSQTRSTDSKKSLVVDIADRIFAEIQANENFGNLGI